MFTLFILDIAMKRNSLSFDKNLSIAFLGPGDLFSPNNATDPRLTDRLFPLFFDLYKQGYRNFITGLEEGFDLAAANVAAALKRSSDHNGVKIVAELAWQEQHYSFGAFDRATFDNIVTHCDQVGVLSDHYFIGCRELRDERLLEAASLLLTWDDGTNLDLKAKLAQADQMGLSCINFYEIVCQ